MWGLARAALKLCRSYYLTKSSSFQVRAAQVVKKLLLAPLGALPIALIAFLCKSPVVDAVQKVLLLEKGRLAVGLLLERLAQTRPLLELVPVRRGLGHGAHLVGTGQLLQ